MPLQPVLVLCAALLAGAAAKTSLKEAFTWKVVDFQYPSQDDRQNAIQSGEFIPGNNVPVGMEVWEDKVFLTIPRWKTGVPASLAYINSADPSDSPVLKPYPDWSAHNQSPNNARRIVSPFRIRADSCDRLWILDTGTSDVLGNTTNLSPPQVIVYDLKTDRLLRQHTLPEEQVSKNSFFASLAVDVVDSCTNTYGYLADLGSPGLVVYSWASGRSWKITNEAFKFDPRAINFDISDHRFTWQDGVFGLALTEEDPVTKYRTLYFHAFSSFDEYRVSTRFLREEQLTRDGKNENEFKKVGSRALSKTQASASFIDEATGVLFYTQVNLNGVGCWNYRANQPYTPDTQELIAVNDKKLVFPNDIKVDSVGRIWVLSDNMIVFLHAKLDPDQVNFRLLTAPVKEFVSNTKCDAGSVTDVTSRIGDSASQQAHLSVVLVPLACLVNYWCNGVALRSWY